jgi:hypothetical protein
MISLMSQLSGIVSSLNLPGPIGGVPSKPQPIVGGTLASDMGIGGLDAAGMLGKFDITDPCVSNQLIHGRRVDLITFHVGGSEWSTPFSTPPVAVSIDLLVFTARSGGTDWSRLAPDQLPMIKCRAEKGGGLIVIGGFIHTVELIRARTSAASRQSWTTAKNRALAMNRWAGEIYLESAPCSATDPR